MPYQFQPICSYSLCCSRGDERGLSFGEVVKVFQEEADRVATIAERAGVGAVRVRRVAFTAPAGQLAGALVVHRRPWGEEVLWMCAAERGGELGVSVQLFRRPIRLVPVERVVGAPRVVRRLLGGEAGWCYEGDQVPAYPVEVRGLERGEEFARRLAAPGNRFPCVVVVADGSQAREALVHGLAQDLLGLAWVVEVDPEAEEVVAERLCAEPQGVADSAWIVWPSGAPGGPEWELCPPPHMGPRLPFGLDRLLAGAEAADLRRTIAERVLAVVGTALREPAPVEAMAGLLRALGWKGAASQPGAPASADPTGEQVTG